MSPKLSIARAQANGRRAASSRRADDQRRSRTERLQYIFNRCALELDASGARPALTLADEFGWHRSTFWKWAEAGRMPVRKAKVLFNRFGVALDFTVEDLTGESAS